MPTRNIPLVNDQYYHVFNRGINRQSTFTNKRERHRALSSLKFCLYSQRSVSYSRFNVMNSDDQQTILKNLEHTPKFAKILAFCLMPNHFHLLVKQEIDGGISKLLGDFQNSYTRYFNFRRNRSGPLFNTQFKAVLIETDEQLIHVSRYIHLNPYASFIVKDLQELLEYPWSSLLEYVNDSPKVSEPKEILSFFRDNKAYRKFIFDQANYQRELDIIKHLAID